LFVYESIFLEFVWTYKTYPLVNQDDAQEIGFLDLGYKVLIRNFIGNSNFQSKLAEVKANGSWFQDNKDKTFSVQFTRTV